MALHNSVDHDADQFTNGVCRRAVIRRCSRHVRGSPTVRLVPRRIPGPVRGAIRGPSDVAGHGRQRAPRAARSVAPVTVRRRSITSCSRKRSWVAQPGRRPRRGARRRRASRADVAATASPTASLPATERRPARVVRRRSDPSVIARTASSADIAQALGAAPGRRTHAVTVPALIRSTRRRGGPLRAARRPSSAPPDPAGQVAQECVDCDRGSSSDSTSSSTSTGASPCRSVTSRCAASRRASARVRCSPWMRGCAPAAVDRTARRRRGADRPSTSWRRTSSRGGPRPAPRRDPRRATAGRTRARPRGHAGEVAVRSRRRAGRAGATSMARRARMRRRRRRVLQSQTSSVERDASSSAARRLLQQRVALPQRCARGPGAAHRTSARAPRAVSSRKRRRSPGPPFTSARSSGENTLTRSTPSRSRARCSRCLLTSTRLRPLRLISASISTSRPSSWRTVARTTACVRAQSDQRIGRRAPKAVERGEVGEGLGEVRLALTVAPDAPPSCRSISSNSARGVVPEVDELERSTITSPFRAPAPASGGRGSLAADAADDRRLQRVERHERDLARRSRRLDPRGEVVRVERDRQLGAVERGVELVGGVADVLRDRREPQPVGR